MPAVLGYSAFALAMVTVPLLRAGRVAAFGPARTARIAAVTAATGAVFAVAISRFAQTMDRPAQV